MSRILFPVTDSAGNGLTGKTVELWNVTGSGPSWGIGTLRGTFTESGGGGYYYDESERGIFAIKVDSVVKWLGFANQGDDDVEPAFTKGSAFNKDFGSGSTDIPAGNHNHDTVYEPIFTKETAFNKAFGTGTNDVARGAHTHTEFTTINNTLALLDPDLTTVTPSLDVTNLVNSGGIKMVFNTSPSVILRSYSWIIRKVNASGGVISQGRSGINIVTLSEECFSEDIVTGQVLHIVATIHASSTSKSTSGQTHTYTNNSNIITVAQIIAALIADSDFIDGVGVAAADENVLAIKVASILET